MDQAAGHMQAETKYPQKQNDYKNRPEHTLSSFFFYLYVGRRRMASFRMPRVCEY
jgi:hypothetical protein